MGKYALYVWPAYGLVIALLLAFLIIACTLIAYSPVLFNYFVGDDFVHLD